MSDKPICELCGRSSPAGATLCAHCGCSLEQPDDHQVDPLILSFGFRPADTLATGFKAAEALYLSDCLAGNKREELGYRREDVLENEDAYYFPVGWIGCSGHLITKGPLRCIAFGSYIGPGPHIWAHYQGISLEALGQDRQNALKIFSINDRENTLRVLKTFLHPRWVDQELVARLSSRSSLPLGLEAVDLYFGIRGLLDAQKNDWFRFEVS